MHHTMINWKCSNADIDCLPLINLVLIDTLINSNSVLLIYYRRHKLTFV